MTRNMVIGRRRARLRTVRCWRLLPVASSDMATPKGSRHRRLAAVHDTHSCPTLIEVGARAPNPPPPAATVSMFGVQCGSHSPVCAPSASGSEVVFQVSETVLGRPWGQGCFPVLGLDRSPSSDGKPSL